MKRPYRHGAYGRPAGLTKLLHFVRESESVAFSKREDGSYYVHGIRFVQQEDGTVLWDNATFTKQDDGSYMVS